jgi:hypothetical protein
MADPAWLVHDREVEIPALKSPEGRSIAILLRHFGFPVHRIGALWDCNQGRVAEAIGEQRDANR